MTLTLTRTARQERKARRRALDESLARMDWLTPGCLDRPLLTRLAGTVDL